MSEKVEWPRSVSVGLGAVLAVVGGFLDAYTFVSRGGVFANSQTGNLVLFGVEATRGAWHDALRHVPPVIAFIFGVFVAETLKRPRVVRLVRWPARAALVLEMLVLFVVGFLPASVPDAIVTTAVAFVASVQVSTFRTLIRWQYNTTMTTGNLRTAAQAAFVAVLDRDPDAWLRGRAFGLVILAFMLGGMLGALLTIQLGERAAWVAVLLLAVALWMFIADHWPAVRRTVVSGSADPGATQD